MIKKTASCWLVMMLVVWSTSVAAQEAEETEEALEAAVEETEGEGVEASEAPGTAGDPATGDESPELPPPPPPLPPPPPPPPVDEPQVSRFESPPGPADVLPADFIRAPLVEYETAWSRGVGFLIRDRRTVVVLGEVRDRYRRITCKMARGESPLVDVGRVELVTREDTPFVILHLEEDLPGTPLRISEAHPEVGDTIYLIIRQNIGMRPRMGASRGDERGGPSLRGQEAPQNLEPAEASVTGASETTLTVGTAFPQLWHGSPLFDQRGHVVAFFGREGYALRVEHIFDESSRRSGRQRLSPIFGVRLGTEIEGVLNDPIAFDFEAGLSFWDHFAVLVRLGFALGDDVLLSMPANAAHETGIVEAEQRTVNLSLELKYRLLLTRAVMPLYLDFVVGLQYSATITDPFGLALYSTEPACDPYGRDCDLTVGATPGRRTGHGFGPVFGIDVRAGIFTMGYRFIAESLSYEMVNTHRLTFGLSYR